MKISSENKIEPTRGTVTSSYFSSSERQRGKSLVHHGKFEVREHLQKGQGKVGGGLGSGRQRTREPSRSGQDQPGVESGTRRRALGLGDLPDPEARATAVVIPRFGSRLRDLNLVRASKSNQGACMAPGRSW